MKIEVKHTEDTHQIRDTVPVVDMDKGPLALPAHIKIGTMSVMGHKLDNYADQVSEFDIWIETQIKNQNTNILAALEDIFTKAQTTGVILATRNCPAPYITTAHIVKRTIEDLAKALD